MLHVEIHLENGSSFSGIMRQEQVDALVEYMNSHITTAKERMVMAIGYIQPDGKYRKNIVLMAQIVAIHQKPVDEKMEGNLRPVSLDYKESEVTVWQQ